MAASGGISVQDGIYLSTDEIEPALRNEFWRAVHRPIFDVAPASEGDQLRGSVTARPIGSLTIGSTNINSQIYRRDRQVIVDSGMDHYLLYLLVAGTINAECDGTICLFDLTRPYASVAKTGARISLSIPRERIDEATGGRSVHGLLLRAQTPVARLLKSLILDLYADAREIAATDARAVEAAAIDFVAAIVANQAPNQSSVERGLESSLHRHILNFIDAHLADPELGSAMLMAQFQISRAHLYRVFAADGGVATAIRGRRLDIAYRRLKAKESQTLSLTHLAYELGFAGSSQFSRAFRARFGVAPRDVKSNHSGRFREGYGTTLLQSHLKKQARFWSAHRRSSQTLYEDASRSSAGDNRMLLSTG